MLGNSSFSQTGATPNPVSGINNFLNRTFGVPLPKAPIPAPFTPANIPPRNDRQALGTYGAVPSPGMSSANASMVPQGSNPGLLPGVNTSTQQKKVVKDINGNTTTIHPPASNPSVLAQQQMLNSKYGAGLVEDGVAGPKTSAAIAKYLSGGQANTPQASSAPNINTPPATVAPPPATLNVAGQAPNVLAAGQMTPTEKGLFNDNSVNTANENLLKFRKDLAKTYGNIESQPIPLEFQQGREQVLARQAASTEQALTGALQNALTNRGQLLGAAQTQAGRGLNAATTVLGAVAPQFPSYSSQIIQPGLLGKGSSTGNNLNDAVANVVSRLTNGTMTYNDAVAALSGYGQGGLNALQNALPPGFNVAQSNTLAGTQGQIKPAYDFAKAALTRLQDTVKKLGFGQGTNVPGVNAIGDWFSRTFGVNSQQTREYNQAVAEARNSYAQLLAASRGGTPTEYGNQATAAIPDNATPNDIAAALASLESLGGSKLQIYGNAGLSGGSPSSGGGSFAEVW